MKEAANDAGYGILTMRTAVLAIFGAAIWGLAGCSLSGPPPAEYVLGAMPAATANNLPQTGFPIVEVKRVRLPDYLDTTDILERRGNQLVPSLTGRWGERLSVGVTRSLTAALAARLPRMLVTATPPIERPTLRVLVDITAFEPRSDHHVVLMARWIITDGAGRRVLNAEQTSLVEVIEGTDDGAIVAGMSRVLEALADRVAAGIESVHRPR